MRKSIPYEQAVYGTFPFWHRGYAVLAASAGCRPEWLDGLRQAAQRFGERPAGTAERESLFALRLHRGPWMIVGVYPLGSDDRGRPGALAFHALFVGPWSYRRAGASPFVFLPALRRRWALGDEGSVLPKGQLILPDGEAGHEASQADRRRVGTIVAALERGRRVMLVSPGPADRLSRLVWDALPAWLRRRASVATWAFENANRFDLVTVPRVAGRVAEASELVLDLDPSRPGGEEPEGMVSPAVSPSAVHRRVLWLAIAGLGTFLVLSGGVAALRWRGTSGGKDRAGTGVAPAETDRPRAVRQEPGPSPEPPRRGQLAEPELAPEDRRRLAEALVDMLERFCPQDDGPTGRRGGESGWGGATPPEPGAMMARLAGCLRYSGPSLSADDLARLGADEDGTESGPSPEAAMALRWHALTRRFAGDRPLPAGFLAGSTRWQLATLAWSFHVDQEPGVAQALSRGLPDEVVHALADVLAVDAPLPATSLAGRYPALAEYRSFLGRLPRK
jgi:hypothetical protein